MGECYGGMWKRINNQLVQVTDPSRIRFKTYISRNQLEELEKLAEEYNSHVSYLLESGLKNAAANAEFMFSKNKRLKDKVEFRTTCDKEVLERGRKLAKDHNLNFTDVVQASVDYIDLRDVKNKNWRYRIE